ncbi:MAG: hypothetical protein VYA84_02325 [Planctomycetota bacterium]|nr:hypothetical protein [Planctomycetota bacterium]
MERWVVFMLVAVSMLGCGDGGEAVAKRLGFLDSIGKSYQRYTQVHQRAPASNAELLEYMRSQASPTQVDLDAAAGLEEGDVVVIWKADLANSGENGLYVLGFESGVPSTGGYVLMADGHVQLMTSKDFSEARMIPQAESAQ